MSTVKEIKTRYSIRPGLEASAPAATTAALIKWRATSRCKWDRRCSMATSWPSWDKVTQATQLQSTILDLHREISMICPWWHSMIVTQVAQVHSAQLPPQSATIELALPVVWVIRMQPIKHTYWIWSISGRHQTQTQANSNKWWWQRNFSTRVATTSCSQVRAPVLTIPIAILYPRPLQRLNWDSRELHEVQAIQSTRATVATLGLVQLNIKMPWVKLLPISSTRLGSTMAAVIILASNQSIATWEVAAAECTMVR